MFVTDAIGALHAEQVVATGDQRRDDFTLKAHRAVPAALPAGPRGGAGRGAGGGGGRGVGRHPGEVGAREVGDAGGQRVAGVAGEAQGSTPGVTAHSAGQGVLGSPSDVVQRRGQAGLGGAAHPVGSPLVSNHSVGISGSIGRVDGWSVATGGHHTTLVLRPEEPRGGGRGVKSGWGLEGQVSAVRRNHLTPVDKLVAVGVHIDVDIVVVVVAIVGSGVAQGGAWRAVVCQPGAAVVPKVGVCGGTAQRAGAVIAVVGERLASRVGGHGGGGGGRLAPQASVAVQVEAHISAVGVEVVLVGQLNESPSAHGDMCFDLFSRAVHILWHARDLEDWLFVSAGRDDVGVRLLLDPLDGGPLGSHH